MANTVQVSVGDVVQRWMKDNAYRWKPTYRDELWNRLNAEVVTPIGHLSAKSVTSALLMQQVFRPLRARSHDIAQRVRQNLEAAFALAKVDGLVDQNPAIDIKHVLGQKPKGGFRPALLDLDQARALLAKVEASEACRSAKFLHRFQALTAVRPSEARFATWEQFTVDGQYWIVPADQMKMADRGAHVVPLSRQVRQLLDDLHTALGRRPFVFPGFDGGVLADNTVNAAIQRAGFKGRHCAHGWRTTFSTTMHNLHPDRARIIEACLQHYPADVEGRYNRGNYLEARATIMQEWADLLLKGMPMTGDVSPDIPEAASGDRDGNISGFAALPHYTKCRSQV